MEGSTPRYLSKLNTILNTTAAQGASQIILMAISHSLFGTVSPEFETQQGGGLGVMDRSLRWNLAGLIVP
jgi:hypothetical protein